MTSSKRSSIAKDTFTYGSANNIAQLLGMVNSVMLRRFMGPVAMGIWSLLQVILGYCGYASFGTTKALMRDYPYLRGKGEHQKAESLKDLVLTFSMLGSIIPALAILIYLVFKWPALNLPLRTGLFFIMIFLFVQRFYDLLMALLRSDKKFTVLSQLIIFNAFAALGATLVFVSHWNIYGLFIGTAVVTFGSILFIQRTSPYTFHWFLENAALWRELKLGLPLLALAFLTEILKSIDKWVIAKKLGFYDLGLYSIAMMMNSYIFSMPMMFSHVLYPNLQEDYGKKGEASGIKHYLLTPVFMLSILGPFLCGVAIFLAPALTHLFLPKFIPGIPAMKIYLVGTFFLLLSQFALNFSITLDKYWSIVGLLILSLPLNFFLNLYFLKLGWGLEGIALGSALSFAFYGLASYAAAHSHFARPQEILVNLGKLVLTLGIFYGGIFLIDYFIGRKDIYASAVLKCVIFLIFSAPFLWFLQKKTALLKHVGEIFKKKA